MGGGVQGKPGGSAGYGGRHRHGIAHQDRRRRTKLDTEILKDLTTGVRIVYLGHRLRPRGEGERGLKNIQHPRGRGAISVRRVVASWYSGSSSSNSGGGGGDGGGDGGGGSGDGGGGGRRGGGIVVV